MHSIPSRVSDRIYFKQKDHIEAKTTMMFRRSVFLFIVMAIAQQPFSFDTKLKGIAWAWVAHDGVSCKSRSVSVSSRTDWPFVAGYNNKNSVGKGCLYSAALSPPRADVERMIDNGSDDCDDDDYDYDINCDLEHCGEFNEEDILEQQEELSRLFHLLQAGPKGTLRFGSDNGDGVRGLYLNHPIKSGEVVLKIPLDSCLTDNQSPSWLHDSVKNDPNGWATRLAASWVDLHLKNKQTEMDIRINDRDKGHALWSSLLPDPQYLRASLPVHWPEKTVVNAKSTALELAVDNAFFARAVAVDDLVRDIQRSPHAELFSKDKQDNMMTVEELAHHALDIVQTRSCRLEGSNGAEHSDCLRGIAPIFDFINHGSKSSDSANACFLVEEEPSSQDESNNKYLVVRSVKDISQDEEVTIDYGTSARPAWKCVLSYGFVPEYKRSTQATEDGENLAEVYMKGVRYEVADDSIPMDMVADATPKQWIEEDDNDLHSILNEEDMIHPPEILLTPDIASRIAERIADAAYYLLLEPEQILDDLDTAPTPFDIISSQMAAKLRWSQHRILLTCAAGLTQFAKDNVDEEESPYQ